MFCCGQYNLILGVGQDYLAYAVCAGGPLSESGAAAVECDRRRMRLGQLECAAQEEHGRRHAGQAPQQKLPATPRAYPVMPGAAHAYKPAVKCSQSASVFKRLKASPTQIMRKMGGLPGGVR